MARSSRRRSVRLRLTALYGTLFLVCGTGLLATTHLLVRGSDAPRRLPLPWGPGGPVPPGGAPTPDVATEVDRITVLAEQVIDEQRAGVFDELLVQSGLALAITMVLAVALGWWMAGRVLRPLHTITAAAREISATNLHRRLALPGPRDELTELGDTFDDLLDRLETSFQAQRQFVANASHELRTPLARQRAIGQVALDDPDATVATLRAAHERVLVAGARQERLIEAMLTLARSNAGIDVRHPFDLAEVVGEVVATRTAARRPRVALSPCPVLGHRALAERLVENLVDNALQHNVPGGFVELSCGGGRLTVANSGPVVPADQVERLFQPFHRLGPARTGQRLGLGLSIVRAIADAHGAAVEALPRPDGGLVVTVVFAPAPVRR